MSLRIAALAVGAADPPGLARFWAAALGWEVGVATGDEARLEPTDATRFGLVFRRRADAKVGPNRLHLDLTTASAEDQAASVAGLLEAGATHLDIGQRPEEGHVVLADPEGNELCILAPGNRFLAGTQRMGAINCEGRRETGLFWHEALGWPLVWDQDEETAIRPTDAPGPLVTWSGPPIPPKSGPNRWRLELEAVDADPAAEVGRLVALGAAPTEDPSILLDPDGNELAVVSVPEVA